MFVDVTPDPIVPEEVHACVGDPADGAVLLFLGTVRDHNDGRPVERLHYDAYRDMALRELRAIVAEAATRAGTDRIAVVHRTGTLEIGEVSLAVAVSSAHRAETFDAARWIIEEVKRRVPVWKREHYTDGRGEWLPGETPEPAEERA
ncbi:MAG TPA: molybdenum cofactor biosynthesis protein MoaE [Longimicrobiales bacterium]|nr:molybdenum cofactor biosynthesis protein MoaE [Longimicrobiales bacterium]